MTKTGLRIIVLLVLQTLWLNTSYADDRGSLNAGLSNQERIYRGKGAQIDDGYTIDRSLALYADALASGFDGTLANLGPDDRWLDIGAGMGLAILDYYSHSYDLAHPDGREHRGSKAQAVAVSIEDRRTPRWQHNAASLGNNKIQYLYNRRLRDYSSHELGQFQIITDVIGGFSYTDTLSRFVEKVLGFLQVNGSFYTVLQDVHMGTGENRPFYKGSPYLTEITRADGSEVKICAWLKSISCVEVTCEPKTDWKPPIEAYHVRKVCEGVAVPALELVHYDAGTPPERRFKLGN